MLSFAVFDQSQPPGAPAREWPPRHAHLFGADDVPVQADIRFADGLIRCEKRTAESAGLSLQFPVEAVGGVEGKPATEGPASGGLGVITLQTCLLPDREKPYLLSLELARHRLMLILNKLEDWALFDLPPTDPGMVLFEQARKAFTLAVVAHAENGGNHGATPNGTVPYTAEADRLARRALALAMEAGEALSLTQARVQFSKRMSGELTAAAAKIAAGDAGASEHEIAEARSTLLGNVGVILPSPPQVGCVVNPELFTPALQKGAALACDFLTMPMRWVDMEPTEGKYLFAKTDRWIEWAVRTAHLPLVGGPLIDLRRGAVPEWLYIWEHDYETLRELVYEHIKTLVTRYRRTVGTWTVVSGLHVSSNFTLSLEQVMDLTRVAVMVVRKLQPAAKVQVQVDQPWGEYFAGAPSRAVPPIVYADMVNQAGINPDLFSLRIEMGQPELGRSTRDLMALSAILDKFAGLERPISLAAVSAPNVPPAQDSLGLSGEYDPGHYRKPWSPETQAHWMTQVMAVAVGKPYVHSVAWHELYEFAKTGSGSGGGGGGAAAGGDNRHDGLFDAAGQPRAAFWRLAEIRQAIRNRSSPATLPLLPKVGTL